MHFMFEIRITLILYLISLFVIWWLNIYQLPVELPPCNIEDIAIKPKKTFQEILDEELKKEEFGRMMQVRHIFVFLNLAFIRELCLLVIVKLKLN